MDSKDNIPEDNHVTKQPDEPKQKQKKPGRVAWGNKLAELAKKHKSEKNLPQHSSNILTWTAIGSLVIAITALYYQMKSTKTNDEMKTTNEETPIFDML